MVRNITDVDDSILPEGARARRVPYLELAEARWRASTATWPRSRCAPPIAEPRRRSRSTQIIELVGRLLESGPRLPHPRHRVLRRLDVPALRRALALLRGADGAAGAAHAAATPTTRTAAQPLDFVLWQPSLADEPAWRAPFGVGRPGWHIECSAMAMHEHGPTLDLHGGGTDLIFPHHECEIAQSEALTGKPFVTHWLHSAMVNYEGEKMSKSLGNLVFISDLLKVADPRAIRLALMRHHYRHGFEWYDTDLEEGTALLHRLLAAAERARRSRSASVRASGARRDRRRSRRAARARRARRPRERDPLRRQRPDRARRAVRARRAARRRPRPPARGRPSADRPSIRGAE